MAAQVDPMGGLVPGMHQSRQVAAASSPPQSFHASPTPSVESKPTAEDQQSVGVSEENLKTAAKSVEAYLQNSTSDLKFSVDEASGQYYFKVINPETHETIRQVPSEEVLAMARRLRELSDTKDASGILMDEQG